MAQEFYNWILVLKDRLNSKINRYRRICKKNVQRLFWILIWIGTYSDLSSMPENKLANHTPPIGGTFVVKWFQPWPTMISCVRFYQIRLCTLLLNPTIVQVFSPRRLACIGYVEVLYPAKNGKKIPSARQKTIKFTSKNKQIFNAY